MKTKLIQLIGGVVLLGAAATASAQYTTSTLTFSGAAWSDGSPFSGYVTLQYDNAGTPISVLSLDITTTDGPGGFPGYQYLYNVAGQADTTDVPYLDAIQNQGAVANELSLSTSVSSFFLDWQGSSPTTLYAGNDDLGCEEVYYAGALDRYINHGLGSVGSVTVTAAPEPSTFALAGLGGISALAMFSRRK